MKNYIIAFLSVYLYGLPLLLGQADSTQSFPPFFRGCEELPAKAEEKKACSDNALIRFIANGLQYPSEAIEKNVQGTVVVSFDINEAGKVEAATVEHDIGAGCGAAALKIINAMPRWEAAQKEGKAIRTRMTLPVRFAFDEKKENTADAYSLLWGKMRNQKLSKNDVNDNLNQPIIIRDPYGNAVQISDFQMTLERGKRTFTTHTTNNKLTKKMRKLIKKAKRGGTINLSVAVQKGATFVVIEETLKITK